MTTVNLFENVSDNNVGKVFACPVCGSTDLRSTVIIEVRQDSYGDWEPIVPDSDDVCHEMTNVNNEVSCMNSQCGPAKLADGQELVIPEGMTFFEYWLQANGFPSGTLFDSLSDDQQQEYTAWEEELYWDAWSGVIGDCTIL